MTMVRGQYQQLLAPIGRKVFNQWIDTTQRELEYLPSSTLKIQPRHSEDELEFAGMPPAPEKPENTPVAYSQFVQGGTFRFIHPYWYAYGGFVLVMNFTMTTRLGISKADSKALARSMRFTEEMVAWNVRYQGFASVKSIDGGSSLLQSTSSL